MADTKYNGWTNYETWCVNLWLTNDQGSDEYWREQAQELYNYATADDYSTRDEEAALKLADAIQQQHEEANPCEETNNVFTDLMRAALSEVNWYEIAEHFISDVDKETEGAAQ